MRADFWCSHPHYIDHAAPVWEALPESHRGAFLVPAGLIGHAEALGVQAIDQDAAQGRSLCVFLSRSEIQSRRQIPDRPRPLVFLEHGVGQCYGGKGHLGRVPDLVLVLTTPHAVESLKRDNPQATVVGVGCPKLDRYAGRTWPRKRGKRVVAVSHHWDQRRVPETRSAWPWDREALEAIVASKQWKVVGHVHPADRRGVAEWWHSIGCETVSDFAEVMERADLYVADNSSTLCEFAATDRPVVCLSPPFYRRTVEHGLRFWRHLPGIDCAHPARLEACIAEALMDVPARQRLRREAVEYAYGPLDGKAAERAAAAIVALCESPRPVVTIGRRYIRGRATRLTRSVEFNGCLYPRGTLVSLAEMRAMQADGLI